MDYYTSQKHFEEIFEKNCRSHRFHAESKEQLEIWGDSLRKKLHELIGTDKMQTCPLNPQLVEETVCEGYIRKKILIHTESDIIMPFYMLVPSDIKENERRTAVIACHGHSSNGKESVAGVKEDKKMKAVIDHYNYNYGEVLAQKGYIVFAPDARGFGERRERYDQGDSETSRFSSSCSYLNVMAISLGQTVTGMWLFDLMRLVDYALFCECVNGHISCVGLSGGGLQSLWLGAMDTRIECCVVSGYFYGYLQSLLINYNCLCNYVPNLWNTVDMGDIGALLTPRPLLIETGDKDELNGKDGLKNVIQQVDIVRKAMKVMGKEENVYHDIFSGGHKWNGSYAYEWILKHTPPVMD